MPPKKRKAPAKSKAEDSPKKAKKEESKATEDLKLEQEIVTGVRGSFEIFVRKSKKADGKGVNVWTGVKKGPPRKEKFPEAENLVDALEKALK